jgi:hypothetical protein
VEQAREQDVAIVHAVATQGRDDIEAVTTIGDMHRIEQRELGCVVQATSAARSAGPTFARRCARNWRTLGPHQEGIDPIDDRPEDACEDRLPRQDERGEDQHG